MFIAKITFFPLDTMYNITLQIQCTLYIFQSRYIHKKFIEPNSAYTQALFTRNTQGIYSYSTIYNMNARSPVILFKQHKSTIHHKLCSSLSNLWSVYTFAQLCHDQQLCGKCSKIHFIVRSFTFMWIDGI